MKRKDLPFSLDASCGVPFYRQIVQQVEYNISVSKWKKGEKLPTVRSLAVDLQINPNTVAKAYNELELRGLVKTQVGVGTFIADKEVEISELERKIMIDKIVADFLSKMNDLGLDKDEVIKILKHYETEET